ncbi:tRNA epoxyqueuosine(34) reductase QueG [Bellilinea sp.]|uniref:tRNA epoxyqueuosine(34) reductase QueG n=1 Tax=Bellilinea sp. TaxID=2838785 RepID=UPI002ADDC13B|nr:tRNA epoxyqueuosine(34) reductase QueG [Bellilinea sp.]
MAQVSQNIKEFIKAEASRLGFDLVGFTDPSPPASFTVYQNWLAQGLHGEMTYLSRPDAVARRADPRLILPGVKSIIVAAMRYPRPEDAPQAAAQPSGKIAAYAWGEDYHNIIPSRLSELVVSLQQNHGLSFEWKIYTDSGPVLERDLAQRAGLGWIGKNTCLIHPRMGSYFLLGELFITLAIEPDPPFSLDLCGTCQRCIQACPTRCILPNRTLDARRCISYLTIENKGGIPIELRPALDQWVFGCDICQQVCPWNIRFASPQHDPAFSARDNTARPVLTQEICLSSAQFKQKFKQSSIQRAKRRGYLRNIAVALGNLGDEKNLPELADCLKKESEPLARAHAAWAIGQIGNQQAWIVLQDALLSETNPQVIEEIRLALSRFPADTG